MRDDIVEKLQHEIHSRCLAETNRFGIGCYYHIVSQPYIKNDITAVHWRSITSGEMVRRIIGSRYR